MDVQSITNLEMAYKFTTIGYVYFFTKYYLGIHPFMMYTIDKL